jgi:Spy/CpxP family protein refolding chaperone
MKIKTSVLIPILAFGFAAHAEISMDSAPDLSALSSDSEVYLNSLVSGQMDPAKMPKVCQATNVTSDQEKQIQDAVYQYEKDDVTTEASINLAKLELDRTIRDSSSDFSAAQKASAAVAVSMSKKSASQLSLATNILYNILKPEQRQSGYECLLIMEQATIRREARKSCSGMPRRGHHGKGHGQKPGQGEKPPQNQEPVPAPKPAPSPAPAPAPAPTPTPPAA